MNIIETLAYAGLGMASEASDKAKAKFDELVETGKKQIATGKTMSVTFSKQLTQPKMTFKLNLIRIKKNWKIHFHF